MKMRLSLLPLVLALLTVPSFAHGGSYPAGPPGASRPTPPRVPAGVPRPPPKSDVPPGTPTLPLSPSSPGAGQLPHPLSPMSGMIDFDSSGWSWWWEFNKEGFLDLRARLTEAGTRSGSDGFFLGRGTKESRLDEGMRPSAEQIRGEIIPALLRSLEGESSPEVLTACLIAIARIGEEQRGVTTELGPALRRFMRHPNGEVAETAVIAQGILGDEGAVFLLADLAQDTAAGRDAVGETEVTTRVRAFAAYALTLLGANSEREDVRRFVVHALIRTLEQDDTASSDLSAACILGLGRVPLATSGRSLEETEKLGIPASGSLEAQLLFLLAKLDDRNLRRLARAHLPTSLARLVSAPPLDGTALKERVARVLLARLTTTARETREFRQSCAIGLGGIGDSDGDPIDEKIRRVLVDSSRDIGDLQARHFALIAVGQVAAREGRGVPEAAVELRQHLLRRFALERGDLQQWTALALALAGRGELRRGEPLSEATTTALRFELRKARVPASVGAFSIACGLLGDIEASPLLLDKLEKGNDERARGHAAIGLGLMNARDSVETIRELIGESTYRPDLLRELVIALGLLRDHDATELLLRTIDRTRSLAAQASIARALGRIGDRRTVGPLVALLTDERLGDRARSFMAVALGLVADKDELPWNTILGVGLNYTAAPPTLFDHQGKGVLNIL
jgi:HEAT repeat protein